MLSGRSVRADLSAHAGQPRAAAWALREVTKEAGQIAAREMEIVRIRGAMQKAEELSDDVAAAIERAL
jgi:hypothetical protein